MASALILIDIQIGFNDPIWGARNNPGAEDQAGRLLKRWRSDAAPIVHIRHVSTEPDSPLGPMTGGTRFKPQVTPMPGEVILEKSVNSAFIGTGLDTHLRDLGVTAIVTCGLTTPHCVSTTTRMGANLGFDVRLSHDATAAFEFNANTGWSQGLDAPSAEQIHTAALSHIHGEFARVMSTDAILEEGP